MWGAGRGRGAACARGCPSKELDGVGDGEALNGPWYKASCPGSYTPPKN